MEQTNFTAPEQQVTQPARPPFLNTLCILSFIMCGILILAGIWNLINSFSPYTPEEIKGMEMMGMDPAKFPKNPMREGFGLIFQLASLGGVIMMWKLRKTGFYVYVAAEVAPYILGLFSGGGLADMMGPLGATFATIIYIVLALAILIDIAFIIMYAVNLKHMH